MTADQDAFWDEMGISWRATIADEGLFSARLKDRVRLQSLLARAAITGGLLAVPLGTALASWTLWIGWSGEAWNMITRGITLAAVSLLVLVAVMALWSGSGGETSSLRRMLIALIARTQRLVLAADLGCIALVLLAGGGAIGWALRTRVGHPPALSPLIDLLVLALAAIILLWFRWSQAGALVRYRALQQAFGSAEEE